MPLPTGGRVWGGGCAPSPENFLILALRMVGFGAFWVVFFKVELFVLHAKNQCFEASETCYCTLHMPFAVRQSFFFILVFQNGVLLQFKAQVYETCLGIFEA